MGEDVREDAEKDEWIHEEARQAHCHCPLRKRWRGRKKMYPRWSRVDIYKVMFKLSACSLPKADWVFLRNEICVSYTWCVYFRLGK